MNVSISVVDQATGNVIQNAQVVTRYRRPGGYDNAAAYRPNVARRAQ